MARPKPQTILTHTDKDFQVQEILFADGIYAVFYDGQPINIKKKTHISSPKPAKYQKSSFSNPGHAFNLAEKLNSIFKTDKFKVFLLEQGIMIDEKV